MVSLIGITELGYLGVDSAKTLVHWTGNIAVVYLILTLSATPALRLFKSRWLMQRRRELGLWTLYFSLAHLSFYVLFLLPSFSDLWVEIIKKPYITVGFLATLILTLLGITSNKWSQKKLKKMWNSIHKLVYLSAILIGIHWLWQIRSDYSEFLLYIIPLAILLGWRVYKKYR